MGARVTGSAHCDRRVSAGGAGVPVLHCPQNHDGPLRVVVRVAWPSCRVRQTLPKRHFDVHTCRERCVGFRVYVNCFLLSFFTAVLILLFEIISCLLNTIKSGACSLCLSIYVFLW